MLSFKVWTVATALFTAISYVLCVLGGLLLPGLPIPHRTLELLLPGFAWISTSSRMPIPKSTISASTVSTS